MFFLFLPFLDILFKNLYFILIEREQPSDEANVVIETDTETLKHEDTSSLVSMTSNDRVGERNDESLDLSSESSGYRTSSQISHQEQTTNITRSFNYK